MNEFCVVYVYLVLMLRNYCQLFYVTEVFHVFNALLFAPILCISPKLFRLIFFCTDS